jgi:hypothetical protein
MLGVPRSKITSQHSLIAKEQTSSDVPSLRVGQQFDHFGHVYEIVKIGRDQKRTVQIARRYRDPFGKEAFIDHRSFPARHFDQQHLRLITAHSTIKAFDAPMILDGTRITLTNAERLVRAHVPDAFVDTHHAYRHSKKTYWVHRESSVTSIGQGPTKKAAWKDAAYRLSLLPSAG